MFQFESDGIRELLKRMKPDNIRDLIACTALYRPGPLGGGMVDAYVNCKHGREKPSYPHPVMEEILAETYGVMVYQEADHAHPQPPGRHRAVQRLCLHQGHQQEEAGRSSTPRRAEFVKGAQERGLSAEETAEEIFELIVKFGGYGFNKSHSARLRAHRLPDGLPEGALHRRVHGGAARRARSTTATSATCWSSTSTTPGELGVEVLPPDVNRGEPDFTVQDGKIVFGLTAIKGVGRGAAEEIVRARQDKGPFRDLFDFCERIDPKIVQKAAIEKTDQGRRPGCFRPAVCASRPVARGVAGRDSDGRGPAKRSPTRPAQHLRPDGGRWRSERQCRRRGKRRRCRPCRAGRTRSNSRSRRKRWTSTFRATHWPNTTRR